VTSAAVERSDWGSAVVAAPDIQEPIRALLAQRWAADAALEHASVASFARFVLDLLALGAPASMVRDAQEAMRNEIAHAERCYALASRHAGRAIGPGPLPIAGVAVGGSRVEIARRALEEGCVGETIAAVLAERTLAVTSDPEAREVLEVIARDEAAHAALAFRFVAWAAEDGAVRSELARTLPSTIAAAQAALADHAVTEVDATLEAHGQPGGALRARAAREALNEVVLPCLAAILVNASSSSAPSAAPGRPRARSGAAGTRTPPACRDRRPP
jgi:hypothetical protein